MFDKIDFYYFSGTGNTLTVVKKMKETFEKNNLKTELFRMEDSNKIELKPSKLIGIAFPVAVQGTYPFVWKFIKNLPKSNGNKIFMVDTLESFSGGVVGPIKRILKSKGYTPIGAKEIKMPGNLFNKASESDKNTIKISQGLKEAENYAIDLINLKTTWPRVAIISDIMSIFSRSTFFWKVFRSFFKVDSDRGKCIKCGLCSKLCPVDNITMNDFPDFGTECVFCMRCLSFCPVQAISVKSFGKVVKSEQYKAVKVSEILNKDD